MRLVQKKALFVLGVILVVSVLALLLLPTESEARIWEVDDDGGQDFENIQDAINASEDGDEIWVFEGVYRESLNVTKEVLIIGNHSSLCLIQGPGEGPVVNLSADRAQLARVSVRGGKEWPNAGVRVTGDNCILGRLNCSGNYYGVLLENARNTQVLYSELSGNSIGCQVKEGQNNTIQNNSCSNQTRGISLEGSRENRVENNSCTGNLEDGILLWDGSDNNLVANNSCQSPGSAIRLSDSHKNTLKNNICTDSYQGIYLHQSEEATLRGNEMVGCGVFIFGAEKDMWASHDMDRTNTVNGKPLHYEHGWISRGNGGGDPSTAGQLIITDCHAVEWTIEGGDFSNGTVGILAAFNDGLSFKNISCDNNSRYGIGIFHDGVDLENVSCFGNENHGIYYERAYSSELVNVRSQGNYYGLTIYDTDNVTLKNCRFTDNHGDGILIRESNDCDIQSSTISRNKYGVRLISGSERTQLRGNTITNNSRYGLEAGSAGDGGVDAKENWWGRDSGPYHASKNPEGEGDNVTGDASLYPWTGALPYTPPEAFIDSINPASATEGEELEFRGHGKGSCGIVGYAWYSDLDGEIYNGSKGSFTSDELSNGSHTIEFQVMDDCGNWSERVGKSLKVNGIPRIVFTGISPVFPQEGEEVEFSCHVEDDGAVVRYAWSVGGEELQNSSNSGFKTSSLLNGSSTVSLMVQDDDGAWSQPTFFSVRVNGRPRAKILSVTPTDGFEKDSFSFDGLGLDDGDVISYLWSSSLEGNFTGKDTDNFTWDGLSPGDHEISLKVKDDDGVWSEEAVFELTVKETPPPPNKLPSLTVTSPANGSEVNSTVELKGMAADEDGSVKKVEISINGSAWMEITGTTSWSHSWNTSKLANGSYQLRFRAFDGEDHSNITVWELVVKNENKTTGGENGNGEEDPDDDDGDEPIWVILLVLVQIILVVAMAAALIWLVRKRQAEKEAAPKEEKQTKGS